MKRKRTRGEQRQDSKAASQEKESLPGSARKNAPSTPASRLALPDLIGMGDVIMRAQQISPDERIEWDLQEHNAASPFCGIKKARKRARSSSPVGSSPSMAPGAQVDPGSELWGRYSLNGSNVPTPQGSAVPALSYIMHISSPQPLKERMTPRSGASLRRANSCGNQFPKRRRVVGPDSDDVFTESAAIGPSKLSVLIEMVQEGLTQPQRPIATSRPSSPSHPSLRRYVPNADSCTEIGSPVEQNSQQESPTPINHPAFEEVRRVSKQPPECIGEPSQQDKSNSSDYGDFDDDELDASLLEVFDTDAKVDTFKGPQSPPSKVPPDRRSALHREDFSAPTSTTTTLKTSRSFDSSTLKADPDEFDDSDEEMFLVDLENIASQFDEKSAGLDISVGRAADRDMVPSRQVEAARPESDDEFGDDGLNDIDFEAAEATATQSIQQTANSFIPVRTRYP